MEIAEIKKFFEENKIPTQLKINRCETIIDAEKFIKNHLSIIESGNNFKYREIYLKRVLRVIELIKKESQN
jgi:hypothetical protein